MGAQLCPTGVAIVTTKSLCRKWLGMNDRNFCDVMNVPKRCSRLH